MINKNRNFVPLREDGKKLSDILLHEDIDIPSKTTYAETIDQMCTNVIKQDQVLYQEVIINYYNPTVPDFNKKLNADEANELFKKYVVPITYRAASGKRGLAIGAYIDLLKELNAILLNKSVEEKNTSVQYKKRPAA